jgi:L-ascorbate metabolism protein UlaG (beta-lactamase superfamily)
MDIIYVGHSCFRLKGKNTILVTDPYNPSMVGLTLKTMMADIVTVSHQHEDHNFVDAVSNVKKVIDGPGEYEISGVSIIGLPSFHDDKKGKIRGKNIIYIIEMDGLRIVHLGDLGHKLSEQEIESLGSIDILMVPTGGEFTIGPTVAAEVTRAIDPYIIIPMHYQVEGLKKEIYEKLSTVDAFLADMGVSVERADKLTVKKDSLTDEQKVVILESK